MINKQTEVVIALAFGLTIIGFCLSAARRVDGPKYVLTSQQIHTRLGFHYIRQEIDIHIKKTGDLPRSLKDLRESTDELQMTRHDHGVFFDGWNRPYIYAVSGNSYLVISYGRDGKLGGTGLDCDLTSTNPWPRESFITLAQFVVAPAVRPMVWTAIVFGMLGFGRCKYLLKLDRAQNEKPGQTIGKLVVLFLVTTMLALITFAFVEPTKH